MEFNNMSKDRGRGSSLLTGVVIVGLLATAAVLAGKLWGLPFSTATKDHSPPPVLLDLRNLSDYHAAQAEFEITLDQEKDVQWLPSFIAGERVQFVAVGTVDATVDFRTLGDDAVQVSADGTSVTITLPRATLAEPVLDLELSHVMNRDRGLLNRVGGMFTDNPTSERELLLNAESTLADAAAQTDLLQRAEDNTKTMLYTMLRSLGFESVDVRFEGEPPAAPTTDE
jgi:hypothetical protein